MDLDNRKLAPNVVWLFAVAALGVAILATKLVSSPLSPKAWAGIYGVVYGIAGAASALTTRTKALRAIGAFALAALGLGVFWYVSVVRHGGGGSLGTSLGAVFAAVFTTASLAGGIGGALFGLKARKGMTELAARRPQGG